MPADNDKPAIVKVLTAGIPQPLRSTLVDGCCGLTG